ncbi:MAG: hypothetical protein NTW05_20805, partial [Pseudonocardiales bacterium]|nr:hypothetical protein [Pseudonocardiales bacterium]
YMTDWRRDRTTFRELRESGISGKDASVYLEFLQASRTADRNGEPRSGIPDTTVAEAARSQHPQ